MVVAEVDSGHEAAAAHLCDLRHCRHLVERLAQQADLRLQAQERVLGLKGVEVGEGRRAGERAASEGVSVEERARVLGRPEEPGIHALGGHRGRQWHIAAGQPLPEAEEVGRDTLLLAGKHRAGAPEPGRDLVADQEDVVAVTELAHLAQVARRLHPDARGALDERLHDHRRHLLRVEVEHALELLSVAGVDAMCLEEERRIHRVEEIDPADGDRAERVAVVRVAKRDERGPPRVLAAALLPVLERHLQRDLGGRRARVGVEDAVQSGRRQINQPRGQLGGTPVRQSEHRRVCDPLELVVHGLVDQRVAVPMDVAPQRGDAVDVAIPLGVDEVGALGPLDHQWLLSTPVELLCERVPEVTVVEVANLRHRVRP